MEFYFSVIQIVKSAERLERDIKSLAGRAFRISPRDSRSNRDLLEKCGSRAAELKELLDDKFHPDKIILRHASLLDRLLQLSFQRMVNLGETFLEPEGAAREIAGAIPLLFLGACRHLGILRKTLDRLTGIPQALELKKTAEGLTHLQREALFQGELFKLLGKALKASRGDQELHGSLAVIRKELLEARKILGRLSPNANRTPSTPALSAH